MRPLTAIISMISSGTTASADERQRRVHFDHHDDHPAQHHQRRDHRENPVHRDRLEREGVVGDPHHQIADLAPPMERQRQPLQMIEHLRAQLVDHPLADRNRDVIIHYVQYRQRHVQHYQRRRTPPSAIAARVSAASRAFAISGTPRNTLSITIFSGHGLSTSPATGQRHRRQRNRQPPQMRTHAANTSSRKA